MKKTTKTTARKPAPKAAKVEKIAATKPSRSSGKKLFPTDTAKKTNPRREKSHGHRSLEAIRTKPGITYEQFLRAGGRRVDLAWHIEHGNAEAKG
jgi:hypothetical protein